MQKILPLALLAALLSGCFPVRPTVTVGLRFGFELNPILTRFEPDRGRGAGYLVGESVRFIVSLTRAGYVTLVGIDPDGLTYEFDRVFLNPGTHLLSGPPGFRYELRPPLGLQRVRAIYTDTPHPSGFVFRGTYSAEGWDQQTSIYIQRSGSRVRDVAETYFFIR
ncbi:MAG: DUF4384 domain-containing protein [Meiothermus sp.]|uniref:DUF4384 domain-containing protein n=1 Tax=Meiothermus sp. TaxID=1955249 RepID=UPI0025F61F8D|nr:DUF4384 domain-containing protein [Meiothermus sp.]MCS7068387.1 DUF4384 domain-containing protein [Meiothermus sp.]MCX7601502.1 DUF4384 domain-containing protein [Meiothermus sp.]MDW8424838.1 DUF4384 domain-containing protein [Meiothermus sp.]